MDTFDKTGKTGTKKKRVVMYLKQIIIIAIAVGFLANGSSVQAQCEQQLILCRRSLTECDNTLSTVRGELNTCNGNLSTAQSALATCTASLADCPADISVMAIARDSAGNLFAALKNRGVYKLPTGGTAWSASNGTAPQNLTNLNVRAVVVDTNADLLYVGTYGGGVFKSADGGAAWNACGGQPTNLNVVSMMFGSGKLYAGTAAGVFVSTDSCSNWTAQNTGLPQ